MDILNFITGFVGVVVGALLVIIGMSIRSSYEERKEIKNRELDHLVREIETVNLLNKKINEILQKRDIYIDTSTNFLAFEDCFISVDDFIYLSSFAAQNNFYLPTFLVEELFKDVTHRKVILSPKEISLMGGHMYKGGRLILESFSEDLLSIIEDKKKQMTQLTNKPIHYFSKNKSQRL